MLVYSFLTPGDYGGRHVGTLDRRLVQRRPCSATSSTTRCQTRRCPSHDLLALGEAVAADHRAGPRSRVSDRLLHRHPARAQRNIWLFLITIPFWTNLLIRTFAIMEVIRNEGVVNTVCWGSGVIDEPIQMLYTDFAIMIGMTYVYLPLMVLPLYASMEKLRLSAGRGRLRSLRHPLAGPATDHPAAGQAGHRRRLDPGLHPVARRLCHARGCWAAART